jgi:hypothetical protein
MGSAKPITWGYKDRRDNNDYVSRRLLEGPCSTKATIARLLSRLAANSDSRFRNSGSAMAHSDAGGFFEYLTRLPKANFNPPEEVWHGVFMRMRLGPYDSPQTDPKFRQYFPKSSRNFLQLCKCCPYRRQRFRLSQNRCQVGTKARTLVLRGVARTLAPGKTEAQRNVGQLGQYTFFSFA